MHDKEKGLIQENMFPVFSLNNSETIENGLLLRQRIIAHNGIISQKPNMNWALV